MLYNWKKAITLSVKQLWNTNMMSGLNLNEFSFLRKYCCRCLLLPSNLTLCNDCTYICTSEHITYYCAGLFDNCIFIVIGRWSPSSVSATLRLTDSNLVALWALMMAEDGEKSQCGHWNICYSATCVSTVHTSVSTVCLTGESWFICYTDFGWLLTLVMLYGSGPALPS